MPLGNSVARDELAYWENFLGKTKISLDDARYQGYTALGGTGKSVNDLERSVLITSLGLAANVAAKLTINDLRYMYYSAQLGNPAKQGMQDLAANFWKTSGFAPQVTWTFRDVKSEGTAAAQTKTILGMAIGPAVTPRLVVVSLSCTATAAPSAPTLGGQSPLDFNIANNGAGRYVAIATFHTQSGTTADLVWGVGVGQTIQDIVAVTQTADKIGTILGNGSQTVAAGATSIATSVTGSGWKLGDYVVVAIQAENAGIFGGVGLVPGYLSDISIAVNTKRLATGHQLLIPNNDPYTVTYSIAAGTLVPSVGIIVRIRPS